MPKRLAEQRGPSATIASSILLEIGMAGHDSAIVYPSSTRRMWEVVMRVLLGGYCVCTTPEAKNIGFRGVTDTPADNILSVHP